MMKKKMMITANCTILWEYELMICRTFYYEIIPWNAASRHLKNEGQGKIVKAVTKQVTLMTSDDWWGWRRADAEHSARWLATRTRVLYIILKQTWRRRVAGRTAGNVAVSAAAADDVACGRITCDLRWQLGSARLGWPRHLTRLQTTPRLSTHRRVPSGSPNGLTSVISRDAYVRSDKCRHSSSRKFRQTFCITSSSATARLSNLHTDLVYLCVAVAAADSNCPHLVSN